MSRATSPPTRLADDNRTPLPMGRRDNRAVLAQCEWCGVIGTASTNGRRIVSLNIASTYHRGRYKHVDCGGSFSMFDIGDDQ